MVDLGQHEGGSSGNYSLIFQQAMAVAYECLLVNLWTSE
jgi:hypothetical protein